MQTGVMRNIDMYEINGDSCVHIKNMARESVLGARGGRMFLLGVVVGVGITLGYVLWRLSGEE